MLRTIRATRYVLPLREGGSLPAIVEADDSGLYVLKFRGAGQGPLALVAEIVAGEIGRTLGLAIPDIALAEVDPVLGRNEPDAEIRHLLKASTGLNLAIDYLPGSMMFDTAAGNTASAEIASMAVWFDAFVQNVDRTPRNTNLLMWHRKLFLIDHGAALFFHHNWQSAEAKATSAFPESQNHVLLPWATAIETAGQKARKQLEPEVLQSILELVPGPWLESDGVTASERRVQYLEYFVRRLEDATNFEEEAIRAHRRII